MPHSKTAPPSPVAPLALTAHLHDCLIRLTLTGFQVRARVLTYADQFHSDDDRVWIHPLESNPAFQQLHLPGLPTIVCLAAPPTSLLDTVDLVNLPNPDDMNQRLLWHARHSMTVEWSGSQLFRLAETWARLMDVLQQPALTLQSLPHTPTLASLCDAGAFLQTQRAAATIPSTPPGGPHASH